MKKLLVVASTEVIALVVLYMSAYATGLDEITVNMVLETSAQADLYEEPSDESKLVTSLEAGTVAFTAENADNSWCKISAGDYTGYIKVEYLKIIGDQNLINQEFEQSMNDNHMLYDEIEQLKEQNSQREIIRMLITGLVIAVIVTGGVFIKNGIGKSTQQKKEKH